MGADSAVWRPSRAAPRVGDGAVHVWRASLDVRPGLLQAYGQTLAPDEQARAGRFHFEQHRNRYVAGRGILRALLGACLGVRAEAVRFRYGPHGRPELEGGGGDPALRFNVSHSEDLGLFAIARGREVGVDVEAVVERRATEAVAERAFSPGELAKLRRLPPEQWVDGFFTCWTRKEAFIKAKGMGLAVPLRQFEVGLEDGEPIPVLRTGWDPGEASRWSLRSLPVAPGFKGAVAADGHGWILQCWGWQGEW